MGRLALPSLIVQALAPFLGALLVENMGPADTMTLLCGLAALNCVLIVLLRPAVRRQQRGIA
jgi:hypothetical protein